MRKNLLKIMINNFSIILSNNFRSKIYLEYLLKNKFLPSEIIFLHDGKKNLLYKLLKKIDIKIKKFHYSIIDNEKIIDYILNSKNIYFIYSGYSGYVIKNANLLSKKKILHAHPGKLPEYKGSTTIFYSILNFNKIYCSTMILNKKIDDGEKLNQLQFKLTCKNFKNFDFFDARIRIITLVDALKKIQKNRKFNKRKKNKTFNNYYVAHPIIRYLAKRKVCG